jgi:crossover junction endodeoxyribonuclease RuvC
MIKKTVVGTGGARKHQVGAMVARLLRLKSAPQPADAADGVAAALTFILRTPSPERRGGQGVRTGT